MTKNAYRGRPNWPSYGGYYIHYHQENIGAANKSSIPNIVKVFNSQKTEAHNYAKNTYKQLYKKSLLSSSSMELLQEIFSDDDLMTEANRQMAESLEKALDTNRLQALVDQQRALTEGPNAFGKMFNKGAKERLQAFSDLIEGLANACNLLNSQEGAYVAAELLKVKNSLSANITNSAIGKKIRAAVSQFAKDNEGATVDEQRMINAANAINAFANLLITKQTKSGKKTGKKGLTSSNLTDSIDYIFNTGFAEGVASLIRSTAELAVNESLVRLTGKDTTKAITFVGDQEKVTDTVARSGKADIIVPNATFTLKSQNGVNGGTIEIDLGLSNKTYRTNHFPGLDKRGKNSYGSGSGGNFKDAISEIFGSNVYDKYLAYNVMARRSSMPAEVQALQDIILTRQIVKLFSSRGGNKDFSQFIIANGQVISIWDLVLATENFVGLSSSRNIDQPISLTLQGAEAEKAVKIRDQKERVSAVNKALNSMTIRAQVHIDKLKNARPVK